MSNQNRQPQGAPASAGGQFASGSHDEAGAPLASSTPYVGPPVRGLDGSEVVREVPCTINGDNLSFDNEDGEEVFPDQGNEVYEYIDPKVWLREDGNYHVVLATHDTDPSSYEFCPGDSLEVFRSAEDRDDYIAVSVREGIDPAKIFVVDRFDHSSVKYTVQPEGWDRNKGMDTWDSAPSTVIIIDAQGEGGVTDFRRAAEEVAKEYTNWSNGEVYGVKSMTVAPDGEVLEDETVWGLIGRDYAQKEVNEGGC